TPITILLMMVRRVPAWAFEFWSPLAAAKVRTLSSWLITTRGLTAIVNAPLLPLTVIWRLSWLSSTPLGSLTGFFAILDISQSLQIMPVRKLSRALRHRHQRRVPPAQT